MIRVVTFMDKLKRMGLYDSSLIIVHGDHGAAFPIAWQNPDAASNNPAYLSARTLGRASAALAVKPAGAKGPIQISDAQTILTDLPATIAEEAGLESSFDGISVLRVDPRKQRERLVWNTLLIRGPSLDSRSWQRVEPKSPQTPLLAGRSTYRWGDKIEFGFTGNAQLYQVGEWGHPEDGYTWTSCKRSAMRMSVTRPESPILLKADCAIFTCEEGGLTQQTVNILVNGNQAGTWTINDISSLERTLVLPADIFVDPEHTVITFETPNAESPHYFGLSNDKRLLGIQIRSIVMEEQ